MNTLKKLLLHTVMSTNQFYTFNYSLKNEYDTKFRQMDMTQNLQNGYDSKLTKWILLKTYKMDMTQI